MPKRKHDLDRLNRFTLERHRLNEQAEATDLVKVVGRICGLNAQTARGPYISLWNRIRGFRRDHLDKAFYEDRLLVKTWLMRGTAHMVPSDEFVTYQVALRKHLRTYWADFLERFGDRSLTRNSSKLFDTLLNEVCTAPRTKKELMPKVKHLLKAFGDKEQKVVLSCALRQMAYQGFLCHAEPTGTWYHVKENRFTTVLNWLPTGILAKLSEDEARARLLLSYLHGYGPATSQDFAYWSGFRMPQVREIFDNVRDRIHQVTLDGDGTTYWLRNDDAAAFDNAGRRKKAPVLFLPEFDPLIMGHKDKRRIIDDMHRSKIFLRLADVAAVLMVDGVATGTWNYRFTDNSFGTSVFHDVSARAQKRIDCKAKHLTDLLEV